MAKGGASAARLHGKLAGSRPCRCTGKARGPRFDRTVIPPRKRKRQTKPPPGARAKPKGPRRPNPCLSIVFLEPPANWRVRRGSANARLGHAYPWYATYSSHIPASLRAFPTKKTAPAPARARGGWRVPGKGTRNAIYENRPEPIGPGAGITAGWREGSPTRGDRQSAPWREEDAQGALAFRNGYFSFGASFTSCPRFATTGMVMAFAGQASTQALQRVQSASVRSP